MPCFVNNWNSENRVIDTFASQHCSEGQEVVCGAEAMKCVSPNVKRGAVVGPCSSAEHSPAVKLLRLNQPSPSPSPGFIKLPGI